MGKFAKVFAAVLICELVGLIGSVFTIPSIGGWYMQLNKPGFTPPGWVFGPVWTALYALMGISAYLVWEKSGHNKNVKNALYLFGAQLALNLLWSVVFFGMHSPLYGLAVIILLWLAIALTIAKFYGISKPAGWLLAPYMLWVSFATLLNFYVWMLNP